MQEIGRRAFLAGASVLVAGLAVGCGTSDNDGGAAATTTGDSEPLTFDPNTFTEQTTTITTAAGDKQVTYRFYGPITYVVDADYQSLVVSVPTAIDGVQVDAGNAPIVFANSVGGYMPASVQDATGVGGSGMMGGGGMPSGMPGMPGGEVQSGGNAMLDAAGGMVSLPKLALATGYVVVEPGCRGRTLTDAQGVNYGTAPAAIVDLKAAVRYVRANAGRIPGDTDHIVSTGTSAGGALSALLGASAESAGYDGYLDELGAADASDSIFAVGAWCPITDLEHADGAYEWNWGTNPTQTGTVDATVSAELADQFAANQADLDLDGLDDFGELSADNYGEYLIRTYLQPSATSYLAALAEADRTAYLVANPFITWSDGAATFIWTDYLDHVGARKKSIPAFDAFDLSSGENNLFGTGTTAARHFTDYSAQHTNTTLGADIPELRDLMNPMPFLADANPARATKWWIRLGTKDTDTALTVSANLAAAAAGLGDDVDHLMYWDEGHGANADADDFIAWIASIT